MVRSVADRAFLPAKSVFEQVGNMMILTGKTIVAAVRPPFPYGTEFVGQFLFALQLCWFPMLISTVAFGFGAPGLQAANFLTLFGALDRPIDETQRQGAVAVTARPAVAVAAATAARQRDEHNRERADRLNIFPTAHDRSSPCNGCPATNDSRQRSGNRT